MLALFFGFVLVCGIFFGVGFTMGRSAAAAGGPITLAPPAPVVATSTTGKHNGAREAVPTCAEGQPCQPVNAATTATPAQTPAPVAAEAQPAAVEPVAAHAETPAPQADTRAAAAARDMASGFVVQIAAVTRKEDADTLVGALRKKSYPVFLASDTGDHLFHVQIGPFSDRKEAQAMKEKLAGDGYNAIVK